VFALNRNEDGECRWRSSIRKTCMNLAGVAREGKFAIHGQENDRQAPPEEVTGTYTKRSEIGKKRQKKTVELSK